jgi:SNF2 family DNA or RNA helicase
MTEQQKQDESIYAAATCSGLELQKADLRRVRAFLASDIMLKPHQQRACQWMLESERCFKLSQLRSGEDWEIFANRTDGKAGYSLQNDGRTYKIHEQARCGGGILADEPGLGKTLTMLCCILVSLLICYLLKCCNRTTLS